MMMHGDDFKVCELTQHQDRRHNDSLQDEAGIAEGHFNVRWWLLLLLVLFTLQLILCLCPGSDSFIKLAGASDQLQFVWPPLCEEEAAQRSWKKIN